MIRDLCIEAKRLLKLCCIFDFVLNYEEGCETLTQSDVKYAQARAAFGELYPPQLDINRGGSRRIMKNLPPPSSSFLPCHSNILLIYQPRDPAAPPKDQLNVADGSPARASTPHWITMKSGAKASLMRSTIGHIRA